MISTFISDNHKKWDEYIPEFNFALNTSVQESTRYTPAFLLFGKELRLPGDKNTFPTPALKEREKLDKIYEIVRINQQKASEKQKYYYDKQRRYWKPNLNDRVLKRDFPLSVASKSFCSKLAPKFSGPYSVIKEVSPVIFLLQDERNKRRIMTAHIKDIKKYYG